MIQWPLSSSRAWSRLMSSNRTSPRLIRPRMANCSAIRSAAHGTGRPNLNTRNSLSAIWVIKSASRVWPSDRQRSNVVMPYLRGRADKCTPIHVFGSTFRSWTSFHFMFSEMSCVVPCGQAAHFLQSDDILLCNILQEVRKKAALGAPARSAIPKLGIVERAFMRVCGQYV